MHRTENSTDLAGMADTPSVFRWQDLAADAEDAGLPDTGDILNKVGQIVTEWPVGGPAGFVGTLVAGGTLIYLHYRLGARKPGAVQGKRSARDGFATKAELKHELGSIPLFNNRDRLRPSLAEIPVREIAPTELGYLIGRDIYYGRPVYASCEDVVLVVGPPRVGKSAHMGGTILDAPGPAVVTTTRGDLHDHTVTARAERGPVWVLNATGAGPANTLRWNPVRGCRDPEVAIRRARNILSAQATGDAMSNVAFFDDHACRLLRTLLMAADLTGGTLMDVQDWVTHPESKVPVQILQKHAEHLPMGWADAPRQALGTDPRLRDSVLMTLVRSFEFLASPLAAAMVQPDEGEGFDAESFIRANGTLYMIAEHKERGGVGPLFSALAGEVYEVGKLIARENPYGRLDPHLTMVLDEAATICPLPLHIWTNDAGGNNVSVHLGLQNQSQLHHRWGRFGGDNIWSNSNKLVFGGLSVREHLQEISELCGERDEEITTVSQSDPVSTAFPGKGHAASRSRQSSVSVRRVPVMTTDDIRRIPKFAALYIFRNSRPVVVNFVPVWKRTEVKKANKAAKQRRKAAERKAKETAKLDLDLDLPPMPVTAPGIPQQPAAGVPRDESERRSA